MQVEHLDFVSFLAQDLERARSFYADTLGLEIALMLHRRFDA